MTLATLLTRLTGDEKHAPSAHSTLDVLWVLYDRVLNVRPGHEDDPERDRFFLSKGHGVAGYYAVLAAKGFVPHDWLDEFGGPSSPLGHHPDRLRVPGVEISSGSLGHGLGLAVGTALGLKAQGFTKPRVFVLLGDAELDEGSNHEAIAFAGAANVDSVTAIVIDNRSASYSPPAGLGSLFTVHGWTASEVDGRDHEAIYAALTEQHQGPHVVVARTETKNA